MRRSFHDLIAQQFSMIFFARCYFSDSTK